MYVCEVCGVAPSRHVTLLGQQLEDAPRWLLDQLQADCVVREGEVREMDLFLLVLKCQEVLRCSKVKGCANAENAENANVSPRLIGMGHFQFHRCKSIPQTPYCMRENSSKERPSLNRITVQTLHIKDGKGRKCRISK